MSNVEDGRNRQERLLVHKEPYAISMRKLYSLMNQLQKFEQDTRLDSGNITERAFLLLRNFLSSYPSSLSPEILIGVYGSIIYHDPVDLDADVVIMLPDMTPGKRQSVYINTHSMLSNLQSAWPMQPFHTDIFLVSMEEIKKRAPTYGEENMQGSVDVANQAAHVLTSKLLFDDMHDVVRHSLYHGEIFALAKEYPKFRQGIITNLSETVAIRKERRVHMGKRLRR